MKHASEVHYCMAVKHGQPKWKINPHSQKGCRYLNDTAKIFVKKYRNTRLRCFGHSMAKKDPEFPSYWILSQGQA